MQLNCVQQYLGPILVTIEKLLIFIPGLSKWKLLSNYLVTFNIENVNLLSNPMLTLKMELLIKIFVSPKEPKFSGALLQTPLGPFRVSPQTPLLQSSEILSLGLTTQTGNFWLTP